MLSSMENNIMTTLANSFKAFIATASLIAFPALAEESYTHTVFSQISDHAEYPRTARLRDQQGVVTLAVTVDHTGNVANLKLVNSSGIPAIDHAALEAAIAAAPYPKPAAQEAEVQGRIRFQL
jgi:TonB family protein